MKKLTSIFLSGTFLFSVAVNGQHKENIKLNQIGFYPNAPKLGVVTMTEKASTFYVTSTNQRDTFYKGRLGDERQSSYSSIKTRLADFSDFSRPGSYVLAVPGGGTSYVFRIDEDLLSETAVATLKGFYYQRASMPLEPEFAGKWHRSAGHPDNEVLIHPSAATNERPAGTVVSSSQGWYDAGDYNKYIVNSGITMGTLLSAFEDFSSYFSRLKTNIPESSDNIPDILNEVLYNLRWMLTMQDPGDGGVYHKCTNASFDGMVMPGVTKDTRWMVQKSTAASLDFAAVCAQAARVLKPYEKYFPLLYDSCLKASEKAWAWAEKNPTLIYDQNGMNKTFKPEISTGSYGDRNLNDEWLWAAAELYLSTSNPKYLKPLNERIRDRAFLPSWGNVGMLGYYSVIRLNRHSATTVTQLAEAMKDTVVRMANTFIEKSKQNVFATVMGQSARDFNWGGNAVAANQGILLVQAYLITGEKKYLDGAITNMDYILGRNATGYSFITGYGSKTPMHPHHRQSEADGITEPVPGLLVGGPNIGMQDSCVYPFREIETAYTDVMCSFASNEIAINWNAPVVYLANAIEALKGKAGYLRK